MFELTQQLRQQSLTAEDILFRTVLSNLCAGQVEKEDWSFLQTRALANLPLHERDEFDNAIQLFPNVKTVEDKNTKILGKLGVLVARIEARYNGISSKGGSRVDSEYR